MQGNSHAAREENISELETCIQTLIEDSKYARALDTVLDAISLANHVHCSVQVAELAQQGDWVTVRSSIVVGQYTLLFPTRTSNNFFPLCIPEHFD